MPRNAVGRRAATGLGPSTRSLKCRSDVSGYTFDLRCRLPDISSGEGTVATKFWSPAAT